jgi:hypothetical protein
MVNDAKIISGTQFSTFVRCEAAMALARWQCENAPRNLSTDNGLRGSGWQGVDLLVEHLHSLFADPTSAHPLPSDFSNESSTHLRNCMLVALSSVHAKSGHSPPLVATTLLKFACGAEIEETGNEPVAEVQYDDSHYRAVLFYALSRVRFESLAPSRGLTHPIYEIVALAQTAVGVAFTRARAGARIKHIRGHLNALPALAGNGVEVAAAISCLVEMDIQAVGLYAKGRAAMSSQAPTAQNVPSLKDVDRNGPSGKGPLTGFNYVKYFLPAEARLLCLIDANLTQSGPIHVPVKEQVLFHLCTPAVRAAAFEAFVRLCFAMQGAHEERLRAFAAAQGNSSSADGALNTTYLPAVVEALAAVLKHDSNTWVRQQAAQTLVDAVMDRPARTAAIAISQGNFWNCLDWSDPWALTLPPQSSAGGWLSVSGRSGRRSMQAGGDKTYTQIAMKLLWKLILSSMNFDQV